MLPKKVSEIFSEYRDVGFFTNTIYPRFFLVARKYSLNPKNIRFGSYSYMRDIIVSIMCIDLNMNRDVASKIIRYELNKIRIRHIDLSSERIVVEDLIGPVKRVKIGTMSNYEDLIPFKEDIMLIHYGCMRLIEREGVHHNG